MHRDPPRQHGTVVTEARRYWSVRVVDAARNGAERAAKADRLSLGEYLEGLVRADMERRGWPTGATAHAETVPSAHTRVVAYVRQANAPVGPLTVAGALKLPRASVDADLARAVARGELVRVNRGRFAALPRR